MLWRKCYVVNIHLPLLQFCSRRMTAATFPTNDMFFRNKEPSHSRSKGEMGSCRGDLTEDESR